LNKVLIEKEETNQKLIKDSKVKKEEIDKLTKDLIEKDSELDRIKDLSSLQEKQAV
jgi:hypothetical protein